MALDEARTHNPRPNHLSYPGGPVLTTTYRLSLLPLFSSELIQLCRIWDGYLPEPSSQDDLFHCMDQSTNNSDTIVEKPGGKMPPEVGLEPTTPGTLDGPYDTLKFRKPNLFPYIRRKLSIRVRDKISIGYYL